MAADPNITFITKNGRVIPIRKDGAKGPSDGKGPSGGGFKAPRKPRGSAAAKPDMKEKVNKYRRERGVGHVAMMTAIGAGFGKLAKTGVKKTAIFGALLGGAQVVGGRLFTPAAKKSEGGFDKKAYSAKVKRLNKKSPIADHDEVQAKGKPVNGDPDLRTLRGRDYYQTRTGRWEPVDA